MLDKIMVTGSTVHDIIFSYESRAFAKVNCRGAAPTPFDF